MVTRKVKKHGETDFFHNYFNLKRCKDIIREKKMITVPVIPPRFLLQVHSCFSPDTKEEVVKKNHEEEINSCNSP